MKGRLGKTFVIALTVLAANMMSAPGISVTASHLEEDLGCAHEVDIPDWTYELCCYGYVQCTLKGGNFIYHEAWNTWVDERVSFFDCSSCGFRWGQCGGSGVAYLRYFSKFCR